MLKVVQVGVRRAVWRGVRLQHRRAQAVGSAGAAGPAPEYETTTGPSLAQRVGRRYGHGRTVQTSTVDPDLEEQFVFPDLIEPEDEHQQEAKDLSLSSSTAPPLPDRSQAPHQKHLRALEQQLQILKAETRQVENPDSLIQFHDVDFPLDEDIVASKKKKKNEKKPKSEHKVFGSPDADTPFSNTGCSGCGAILHCTDTSLPGYLPSEKYKLLLKEERLAEAICQRCHLLTHHHKALNLQMSAEQYRAVVQQIRPLKALVLLVVDLLDVPASIVPNLSELVGKNKHVVVLGNKVDLLPGDAPNYLQRIKRQLSQYCQDAGFGAQVTDVHLISAKTGYGIETLITSLQRSWKYKGDVYLVGSANAGKSTLFNTLLESDYCKSKASDIIHKATMSPWPGTTLNLLKFPIINPTPQRMFKRQERLNAAGRETESELSQEELHRLRLFSRQGYLVGRVGRTFRSVAPPKANEIEFDADSLAFGNDDEETVNQKAPSKPAPEFTYNELKFAHWLYDTPGIMKEHDILTLLTEQEVVTVVPTHAIPPRTFVLKPSMSLFVGALARIDFLEGTQSCWFSVLASAHVPVHVTSLEKADAIYEKHAGHELLGVPLGGSERMKEFPAPVHQEFSLEGRGHLEAAADITLSSAGWVAVTAAAGQQVTLRLWGPAAAGFGLRTPPLLPHVVKLKGERLGKSAAYRVMKGQGLLDRGLSATGAQRLNVKKKKKKKQQ